MTRQLLRSTAVLSTLLLVTVSSAFAPLPLTLRQQYASTSDIANNNNLNHSPVPFSSRQHKPTMLYNGFLLNVPDSFFTVSMLGAGILLSLSKKFARLRMEERAWEQRLEEGRRRRLEQDPTLTELDLRRREASMEWSAYGKPRMEQEERELQASKRRVKVMDRSDDDNDDEEDEDYIQRQNTMTDEEIDRFEMEFGIDYDPYYDDPYTLDELPAGEFNVDKQYGDRIYEDGEIFYRDAETGLFYRQGAKPRSLNFWGP